MKREIQEYQKSHLCPRGARYEDVLVFFKTCEDLGLNPFRSEAILLDKYDINGNRKYFTFLTIGGYRRIAEETGKYLGCDETLYDMMVMSEFKEKFGVTQLPRTCSFTIYKDVGGKKCLFMETIAFREYAPDPLVGLWLEKSFVMISKCAESLVLRKAFAKELNGTYIPEELDQMDDYRADKQLKTSITKINKGLDSLEKKLTDNQ